MRDLPVALRINDKKIDFLSLGACITTRKDVISFQDGFFLIGDRQFFRAPSFYLVWEIVDTDGVLPAVDLEIKVPGDYGGCEHQGDDEDEGFVENFVLHIFHCRGTGGPGPSLFFKNFSPPTRK